MKAYLSNLIPQLYNYSKKLDNAALLTNKHWVVVNEENIKTLYIFRSNNDLIIAEDGIAKKAKWELIGLDALLIEIDAENYLFRQGFLDDNILVLQLDNTNKYLYLISESSFLQNLESTKKVDQYLKKKYLDERNKHVTVVKPEVLIQNPPEKPRQFTQDEIESFHREDRIAKIVGFIFPTLLCGGVAFVFLYSLIHNHNLATGWLIMNFAGLAICVFGCVYFIRLMLKS